MPDLQLHQQALRRRQADAAADTAAPTSNSTSRSPGSPARTAVAAEAAEEDERDAAQPLPPASAPASASASNPLLRDSPDAVTAATSPPTPAASLPSPSLADKSLPAVSAAVSAAAAAPGPSSSRSRLARAARSNSTSTSTSSHSNGNSIDMGSTAANGTAAIDTSSGPAVSKPPTPKKPSARQRRSARPSKTLVEKSRICVKCLGTAESNTLDEQEEMISCPDCTFSAHPSCIGLAPEHVAKFATYAWQCAHCKCCGNCGERGDDENILLCDYCDRGFHKYCLDPPLLSIPEGDWTCHLCANELSSQSQSQTGGKVGRGSASQPSRNGHGASSAGSPSKKRAASQDRGNSTPRRSRKREQDASDRDHLIEGDTTHSDAQARSPNPTSASSHVPAPSSSSTAAAAAAASSSSSSSGPSNLGSQQGAATAAAVFTTPVGPPASSKKRSSSSRRTPSRSQKDKGTPAAIIGPDGKLLLTVQSSLSNVTCPTPPNGLAGPSSGASSGKKIKILKQSSLKSMLVPKKSSKSPGQDIAEVVQFFNGKLSAEDADISKCMPQDRDRALFDKCKQEAEAALQQAQASAVTASTLSPSQSGPQSIPAGDDMDEYGALHAPPKIPKIRIGEWEIDTWYAAPYPEEYNALPTIYLCEFCLKYMKSEFTLGRHQAKCPLTHPPGDEIYRDGNLSVFEVDGRKNKIYCQNLCLVAKLFLDHKTLYYDVEPFLFYVMTANDEYGCHLVGYFSKEKRSASNYNVSCIVTLPIHQRKGYGNYLIEFSYLLSKREGKPGSPEKPLSDLGALSYRYYWRTTLVRAILSLNTTSVSIQELSDMTCMTVDDVTHTLMLMDMIVKNAHDSYVIRCNLPALRAYDAKIRSKGYVTVKPENLRWMPFMVKRSYTLQDQEMEAQAEQAGQDADVVMDDATAVRVKSEDRLAETGADSLASGTAVKSETTDDGRLAAMDTDTDTVTGMAAVAGPATQSMKAE
ncbi:hypothetical protein BC831DRAFT_454368 [Entophlyctis helioformis]|nr:hypothetical protein BC831DRAFT_454368 [Entophlyctis helioformis]